MTASILVACSAPQRFAALQGVYLKEFLEENRNSVSWSDEKLQQGKKEFLEACSLPALNEREGSRWDRADIKTFYYYYNFVLINFDSSGPCSSPFFPSILRAIMVMTDFFIQTLLAGLLSQILLKIAPSCEMLYDKVEGISSVLFVTGAIASSS